jgi:hypothetical protein
MPQLQSNIESWLRRHVRNRIMMNAAGVLVALLGGLVATVVTAAIIYMCAWRALGLFVVDWDTIHTCALAITGIFMVVVFISRGRIDDDYLCEVSFTTGTTSDDLVVLYVPGVGVGSNVNPLAPDSFQGAVKSIVRLLFIGPDLFIKSWRCLWTCVVLNRLDASACAMVMTALYRKDGRVKYADIIRAVPNLDPANTFSQLGYVDGILFLERDPPGMMISSELREDLDRVIRGST